MINIWSKWLEDNYVYVAMGMVKTETDRDNLLKLNRICNEHNISMKRWLEVLTEFNAEVSK